MQFFPLFLRLSGHRVLVSGAGETAVAKLRLLLKTEAELHVYGQPAAAEVRDWADAGRLHWHADALQAEHCPGARLIYGANADPDEDARVAELAQAAGVLFNLVDNLHDSDFITPAIVDRDPLTVAIGTEGAAPVLARHVKAEVEALLPSTLGRLTRLGKAFRPWVERLPAGLRRREFWQRFYFDDGPRAWQQGGEAAVQDCLQRLLERSERAESPPGRVDLVGAGPGDPELLTLKARRLLHEADIVIHDRLVSAEILELARREATLIEVGKQGYGRSWKQRDINSLMISYAEHGMRVLRLKSGDPGLFGRLDEELDVLDKAGIDYSVVPGITAAVAAAASMGQSLTRRARNTSLRLLTAHDVEGFAEQDWRALAQPGAVAAIYMGSRAATFLRGRLLMHGADGQTPVTLVANASRADEVILHCTLLTLPEQLQQARLSGPVVMMYGLAPRQAGSAATTHDTRRRAP